MASLIVLNAKLICRFTESVLYPSSIFHLLAFLLIGKDASASRQDMQTSVADLPVSSAKIPGSLV